MSFLIVGHTHADVDALIGVIVSYLRNVDQMSPAEFAAAIAEACKSQDGTIDAIENTFATPDYEKNFEKLRMSRDIDGITEIREIRLRDGDSDDIFMEYKVCNLYLCKIS